MNARVHVLAEAINAVGVFYALREHMGGISDREAFLAYNARLTKLHLAACAALDDLIPGASDVMFWSLSSIIEASVSVNEAPE